MSNINTKRRQSTLDVAIRRLGSIETVFDLASANGVCITDDLNSDSIFSLTEVQNQEVINAFSILNIDPATGLTDEDVIFGGINYMGIELDFMVS